jgi:hypothetical protein
MTLILILGLLTGDDKAATAALDQFKTDYKSKDASARAKAVETLSGTQAPQVTAKLAGLLVADEAGVRCAAAKGLGDRNEDKDKKKAGAALAASLKPNEALPEVQMAIIAALAQLADEIPFAETYKLYDAKEIAVVQAAIEAASVLKSKNSMDPLIKKLKAVDELLKPRDPQGGGRGFGGGFGRLGGADGQNPRELREQARMLQPILMKTLAGLTGYNCQDGKDWEDWWKEKKGTFKIEK